MKSILTKNLDGILATRDESEIPHETNYNIKLRGNKYFDYIFPKIKTFGNKKIKLWRVIIKDPNKISYSKCDTTTFGFFAIKKWKDIDEILVKHFDEYDSDVSIDANDVVYMEPTITITLLRRKD